MEEASTNLEDSGVDEEAADLDKGLTGLGALVGEVPEGGEGETQGCVVDRGALILDLHAA